jgi:hypothetical protein
MTLFQVGHRAHCRTSKFQRELEAIVIRIPPNITPETDLFTGKYSPTVNATLGCVWTILAYPKVN